MKYYIEVIGATTKQQLVDLGINQEHIMEVSDSPFSRIEAAISEVIGVDHTIILGKSHNRYACMARALLVYFSVESKMTMSKISEYIHRPVKWVRSRYDYVRSASTNDKELWRIATDVEQKLTNK